MKKHDVPQDGATALNGERKAIYAIDDKGKYSVTQSSGWEAEEVVLDQAIAEYARLSEDARKRAEQGLCAPLEYHMYNKRMDVTVLAQSTGLFKWQVRRHLKPQVFSRLSSATIARYCEALHLTTQELGQLPPEAGV